MKFSEYIDNWWEEYIDNHSDDGHNLDEIFNQMGYNKEEYLDDDEIIEDFLRSLDSDEVYEFFFGYNSKVGPDIDDVPETQEFLKGMYLAAAKERGDNSRSYAEKFIEDMAYHSEGYSHLSGFFDDLQHGGCQSGMIGMLIYNDDCKNIYINHIDDMEGFIEDFEDELGEPIRNKERLPHYTWVCWLCYEELAYRIAQELFPEKF